jgi:hypothetical protein
MATTNILYYYPSLNAYLRYDLKIKNHAKSGEFEEEFLVYSIEIFSIKLKKLVARKSH